MTPEGTPLGNTKKRRLNQNDIIFDNRAPTYNCMQIISQIRDPPVPPPAWFSRGRPLNNILFWGGRASWRNKSVYVRIFNNYFTNAR